MVECWGVFSVPLTVLGCCCCLLLLLLLAPPAGTAMGSGVRQLLSLPPKDAEAFAVCELLPTLFST